uniref:Cytochrome P450 89A2-like n=1 Tax=Davidia involucrata TaxID=16924 RepID=A0A5B7BKP0_DAVIN
MEAWFIVVVSLCVSVLLKSLFSFFFFPSSSSSKKKLPPGPPTIPVIGNFLWLRKSFSELEPILRDLRGKYGPLITLRIGSRPAIFVGSHSLAHRTLVQNGVVFSDRPKALATSQIMNSNQHNISSAAYGPTWRLLRRNLTSEILHPSRVRSYSHARRWVLGILMDRLLIMMDSESAAAAEVRVVDHFQYAMFCLLALMCFGDKLDENQIKQIETVQRRLLLGFGRFNILNFWPRVGKIVFRNRWKELIQMRQNQEAVLIPLIKARKEVVVRRRQQQQQQQQGRHRYDEDGKAKEEEEDCAVVAYVDTLVDLELPDEKRKLNDGEMVSLCGEFLNAGTDTTSTALQWIMANLLKYPRVQAKVYEEITGVVGPPPSPSARKLGKEEEEVAVFLKEEELQRMPYLKAVVLEGLRRHPPGHFVLPHSVTEDVELDGYVVPKNATVNFMVAEMGLDPKVWDDPMEFKPERFFLSGCAGDGDGDGAAAVEAFDLTGSREIKMMPFGAGRRICPGSALALLHLEYFVANLIWYFEWTAADDDDVDLSEKQEFTVVMRNPLRAHISPRTTSGG